MGQNPPQQIGDAVYSHQSVSGQCGDFTNALGKCEVTLERID